MSISALIKATDTMKKREGDLLPSLKTLFFERLKEKYPGKKIRDVLTDYKGGSWGSEYSLNKKAAKVLRSPDIRFGFIDLENAEQRFFSEDEISNFNLNNNDILVIKSNGSIDLVGKSQLFKKNKDYPFVIASNFLMVLSPDEKIIYPEYLDLFLKSPEALVWRYDTQKTTTGLRNLNSTGFLNIELPVPDSIDEQKELFNLFKEYSNGTKLEADAEIQKFHSLIETKKSISSELTNQLDLVKQLRQAFLHEAMQGKLTEAWRASHHELVSGSNSASQLLANIKAEKEKLIKEGKLKKEKPLPPIKDDEIPFEIPKGWTWCRLGEIGQVKVGSTPSRQVSEYWKDGSIPWVASGEVANNCIFKTKELITEKGFESTSLVIYPKGSVLVAMIGQGKTRGQTSILKIDATTNQNVAGIILSYGGILSEMLWYFFLSRYETTRGGASGGNQPALNGIKISNTVFPLPPIHEQQQIVTKLDELMQYCDNLEESIRASQQQNELLLQQVLREALEPEEISSLI